MSEAPCSICGSPKEHHDRMNHEYNLHNQLITRSNTSPKATAQQPILVVGAIDTGLRRLLLEKGILTNEDFATLFSVGASTEGDRGTGEIPSS
jgi:hypothetical protein